MIIKQPICKMTAVPTKLLLDDLLTLEARGAAAAIQACETRDYTTAELAEILGTDEDCITEIFLELMQHGYALLRDGVFVMKEMS